MDPIRGMYLDSAVLRSTYNGRMSLGIVNNGKVIKYLDTSRNGYYATQSKTFPILLEQDDMIWVRCHEGFEKKTVHSSHNKCSAVLLFEL